MNSLYLTTPRCIIRNFVAEDILDLHEVLSDESVMEFIEPPFSLEDTKAFIADAGLSKEPHVYALVWKESNRVIGHVIFHPYEEDSFEIGWIINRKYWKRGIASEVTASLLDYARTLSLRSCVIECDPRQMASIQIALKFGFHYEREDGGCAVYRLKI